jgi:RNA polymerase sigma factor (sigma-70 family)
VNHLSDESLLAGLASGEPEPAAAFLRRFQGRVFGLAMTIARDAAIAEDIAQEAFMRVWRHADSYDARRGRVDTWVLTIARNVAIDVSRLRGIEPVDPDLLASELEISGGDERVGLEPDERGRLREAIGALPADQRRALVLAAYLGRTAREISQQDGVPLGTIKTRIRSAMLTLRETLEVDRDV